MSEMSTVRGDAEAVVTKDQDRLGRIQLLPQALQGNLQLRIDQARQGCQIGSPRMDQLVDSVDFVEGFLEAIIYQTLVEGAG